VPPGLTDAIAIAAGGSHSVALKAGGAVVAWGNNTDGQTNVPAGLTNAVAVAAGSGGSFALTADGRVVAWGDNTDNQTNLPTGLSNVVAIAAGGSHALALFQGASSSPARFLSIRRHPERTTDLRLLAEPGSAYQIQSSSNLTTWETLATLTNRSGALYYLDKAATNAAARFYRSYSP